MKICAALTVTAPHFLIKATFLQQKRKNEVKECRSTARLENAMLLRTADTFNRGKNWHKQLPHTWESSDVGARVWNRLHR